ncbi:NAD(P)-dependent alcohol dehydrogenase [Opitutaceae bacterium]|nr:NAD(P)-dependent alcohol dehydrogenase [Opitutaceae bacterium]
MRAVTYHRYGPPEVLELADVARPEPAKGELLIRVRAAEVTKADCEMRSFKFAVKWFWLPLRLAFGIRRPRRSVLGSYFAGEVVALGKECSRFEVGAEVWGCAQMRLGAHAEYMCLPESYTIGGKPTNATFVEAASVPLGGLNALHFLDRAGLQAGEKLLIVGGGGSIGLPAIQIAKARGVTVTVVDKTSKERVVRDAGADEFIDYTKEQVWMETRRYDVVFSMVAGGSFPRALSALTTEGRYLLGNPRILDMIRAILTKWRSRRRVIFAFAGETLSELETLKQMIEAGELKPLVDQTFPFSQALAAHHRVESERRNGAIVLVPSE